MNNITIWLVLSAVSCVTASVLAMLKSMHIFQLNSYKTVVHFKWLCANVSGLYTQLFFFLFTILCFYSFNTALVILFTVICGLFIFLNKPAKNAKKPLVYTNRVKRMIAVYFILLMGIIVFSVFFKSDYKLVLWGFVYVLSPVTPLFLNTVNIPVEACVRGFYIRDAKRILKSHPNLLVIGITGSYGKTSVKYFLTTLLKAKYNTLMTPESFNTPMGVVKTIREQLRSTHEIFVCEMGARHKGDIAELCTLVSPTHGIITSIGEQHLETMKTVETIIKTKFELARAVAGRGVIFLNGDNALINEHLPEQERQTYGLNTNNDYYAHSIKVTQSGTIFSMNAKGVNAGEFQTPLIGEHNVVNLTGAMAICSYLGVSFDDMRLQLKKIIAPPHRLQLINNKGAVIIDDAYNSNPSGCEAALKTLALFDGLKILITPGMVELGAKQHECNFNFGGQAAKVCDYIFLVGEKQTKPIYEGLVKARFDTAKIIVTNSFNEAINKAYGIETDKQRVILLENDLPDNY